MSDRVRRGISALAHLEMAHGASGTVGRSLSLFSLNDSSDRTGNHTAPTEPPWWGGIGLWIGQSVWILSFWSPTGFPAPILGPISVLCFSLIPWSLGVALAMMINTRLSTTHGP